MFVHKTTLTQVLVVLIQYKIIIILISNVRKCLLNINEDDCVVSEKARRKKVEGVQKMYCAIIMYFYNSIFIRRATEDVSSYLRC